MNETIVSKLFPTHFAERSFGIHRPLLSAEGITWKKWRVVVRRRASLGPKMSEGFCERASGKKGESLQNTANFNLQRWWFQIFFIFIPIWGNNPI